MNTSTHGTLREPLGFRPSCRSRDIVSKLHIGLVKSRSYTFTSFPSPAVVVLAYAGEGHGVTLWPTGKAMTFASVEIFCETKSGSIGIRQTDLCRKRLLIEVKHCVHPVSGCCLDCKPHSRTITSHLPSGNLGLSIARFCSLFRMRDERM